MTIPSGKVAWCELRYNNDDSCSYINVNTGTLSSEWVGSGPSNGDGLVSTKLNRICFMCDASTGDKSISVMARAASGKTVSMSLTAIYNVGDYVL